MKLSEVLLLDFDREMANTRKSLERVPEEKFAWKPHEKSMPLGRLAQHISQLPSWAIDTIGRDSLDLSPPGSPPYQPPPPKPLREILDTFEKDATAARTAIVGAQDEHLMQQWTLLSGGKTIFSLPRLTVLRVMVVNHMIHHRAQLGVYLRLNGVPVPALYGPSADENNW
jgi:uncharacterized damage-inducible protein DinB